MTKIKPEHYICQNCGTAVNYLDKLDRREVSPGEWSTEVETYRCPGCSQFAVFTKNINYSIGYSRARWQIDASSFWTSNGNRLLTSVERYDYEAHVARLEQKERSGNLPAHYFYEPPQSTSDWVWDDINFMQGLNSFQSQRRLQNHTCPLPFDIVERLIRLYSNVDDLILDMFAGLLTVPYAAIKLKRRAYGIEIHPPYFADGVRYCREIERQALAPTLFDWLELQQAGGVNGKGDRLDGKVDVIKVK